ncbi:MAG: antitoxin yefM [Pseudomonadota bacterium]
MPDAHMPQDRRDADGDQPRILGARHVSAAEFQQNQAQYLDHVRDSRAPLVVTRQGEEGVVIIAEGEWASIQETLHVMATPANARRLMASIDELEAGRGIIRDLIDPDEPGDGHADRLEP